MKENTYKKYLLLVLLILMASNYVDRHALGLLLQDIKVDLSLSDTQLGFMTGIAFALFYSVMGIPIARWADRGDRIAIISLTTAVWSAAVALCGAAGSFVHLLMIRIGVGVGEAGFVPPAHSLIAEHFSRAERPRAVAIFKLGIPLSLLIGYLSAGWLNQLFGWRATFVLLGIPGLLLALLVRFTLKEPRRAIRREGTLADPGQPGLKEVARTLWGSVTFRHLLIAWSIVALFGSGLGKWQPAFFMRSHGLQTGELGTWLAISAGGGGLLGTYLGGLWASRYAAQNERLQLQVMAVAYVCFGLLMAAVYLSPNPYVAFAMMGLAFAGGSAVNGPLFATIQTLIPERMRATSVAILFLFSNLIGMGIGPLVAGALSDALRPTFGEESLRYSLVALCPGYLWCAWHFRCASRTVSVDLQAAQCQEQNSIGHTRRGSSVLMTNVT